LDGSGRKIPNSFQKMVHATEEKCAGGQEYRTEFHVRCVYDFLEIIFHFWRHVGNMAGGQKENILGALVRKSDSKSFGE
jgi:hypothetical protein